MYYLKKIEYTDSTMTVTETLDFTENLVDAIELWTNYNKLRSDLKLVYCVVVNEKDEIQYPIGI